MKVILVITDPAFIAMIASAIAIVAIFLFTPSLRESTFGKAAGIFLTITTAITLLFYRKRASQNEDPVITPPMIPPVDFTPIPSPSVKLKNEIKEDEEIIDHMDDDDLASELANYEQRTRESKQSEESKRREESKQFSSDLN